LIKALLGKTTLFRFLVAIEPNFLNMSEGKLPKNSHLAGLISKISC
jgi:hypothetical protein